MSSDDDPEARIRDLERTLSAESSELTQSSSELGSAPAGAPYQPPTTPYPAPHYPYTAPPGPYPGPPPAYGGQPGYGAPFPAMTTSTGTGGRGWILYGVMAAVLVAIVGGIVVVFASAFSDVTSAIDTFKGSPTASRGGGGGPFGVPPTGSTGNRPSAPTTAASVPDEPAGGNISVPGVGENKTIACHDSVVDVSGVSNTVVITGQCRSVSVSGVENTVTVDSSGVISASGFNNRVTYLSGTPEIRNSGDSNTVEQG
ncbi:MAG: DUF3060 domain-containing protein [Actinomycetota bacterium]|nr:DUF3060 domain-containing protein [Actinomycetota bacterium]